MVAASLGTAFALLATGTIKTDPIELVYSVHDAEKIYDGTPLKATDYRLDRGALLAGHMAEVEVLGSQTDVGSSYSDLSVKIYDSQGYNVTSDYSIKVIVGELTVSKRAVKVSMPSQKVVYNGSKVLFEEYTVDESEYELVSGHRIYGSTEAKLLNVGDRLPSDLKPLVFDIAGNEVTKNYEIDFTMGEIEVIPRGISVRPVSFEKVYDGTALSITGEDYEFLEGSLVEGQWAKCVINKDLDNEITDAGEKETQITSFKIYEYVNGEETEVTGNYDVATYETGLLKVTPRKLTITAPGGSWIYDGNPHSIENNAPVESADGLAATDVILSVFYSGRITNVGTVPSSISEITFNCLESNYDIEMKEGKLEVTPYELTVLTESAEWYYTGLPESAPEIHYTTPYGEDKLANEEHTIDIVPGTSFPEISQVGSVKNVYRCRIADKNNVNVTDNYQITYVYGTLTVNKMPVTISLGVQDDIVYDGEEHMPDLAQYMTLTDFYGEEPVGIDSGDFIAVFSVREVKDANEYSFTVRFSDNSKYDCYKLTILNNGYLKINQRNITVKTQDKSRAYNGMPLSNGECVLADETTLVGGHSLKLPEALPSITDFGTLTNEFKVTVIETDTGADVTRNYALSYRYGVLKINACDVEIFLNAFGNGDKDKGDADFDKIIFNNRAYEIDVEKAIRITFPDGSEDTSEPILKPSDFKIIYEEEIKDVKRNSNNIPTYYHYSAEIADKKFAKNFNVKITNTLDGGYGTVTISPRPVAVSVKSIETTYNGDGYYLDSYSVITGISDTSTGLSREDFKTVFTGSSADYNNTNNMPVNVGVYSVNVVMDDRIVKNYDYTQVSATLTINKFMVIITSDTASYVYDGGDKTCETFTSTVLAKSAHKIKATAVKKVSNVTRDAVTNQPVPVINELDYQILDSVTEKDVTSNYEIITVCGTITITPRPVTLTTGSATITYNGVDKAQSGEVTPNAALVGGHTAERDITKGELPYLINAGEISNVFVCKITDTYGNDVTDSYDITYVPGKLVVKKLKIILETASVSRPYVANAIFSDKIDVAIGSNRFALDHRAKAAPGAIVPRLENVGLAENRFDFVIVDGAGNDVSANYEYTVIWGKLEVTPRTVEVTLDRLNRTYNGKEQGITDTELKTLNIEYVRAADETLSTEELAGLGEKLSFDVNYFGKTVQDAGTYKYILQFANSVNADNFVLKIQSAEITVAKMTITVQLLNNISFDFDNTVKTIKSTDKFDADYVVRAVYKGIGVAGEALIKYETQEGEYPADSLLQRSDFVISSEEMRYAKVYSYTVKFADSAKGKNFTINIYNNSGSVIINPFTVNIRLKDYTKTYSGEEFTIDPKDAITVTNTSLLSANDFLVDAPTIKNAKNTDYEYTVKIIDEKYAENFNLNYEGGKSVGKFKVDPLEVSVYLKEYDYTFTNKAIPFNLGDAVVTSSELLTWDKFNVTLFNSASAPVTVIQIADTYSYSVSLINDQDKTNFALKGVDGISQVAGSAVSGGKITVNKLDVQVTLVSLTHVYDGEAYDLSGNKNNLISYVAGGSLITKKELKLVPANDGLIENVGKYEYIPELTVLFKENINLTYNVAFIDVTPLAITIYTGSDTKVYGEKAINDTPTVNVAGYTVAAEDPNSVPYRDTVGTVDNIYRCIIKKNGVTLSEGNLSITYVYGKLTVTPRHVKVTTGSYKDVFNNEAVQVKTTTVDVSGYSAVPVNEDSVPALTGTGVIDNVFACKIIKDGTGEEVTENFEITYVYGTITVTELQITVRIAGYLEKNYSGNGVALDLEEAIDDISCEYLIKEDFVVTFGSAIPVNAGTYTFTVKIADAQVAKNYEVSVVGEGTLAIKKLGVSVSVDYVEDADYNGSVHAIKLRETEGGNGIKPQVDGYATIPGGMTGDDFVIVCSATMLDAGEYTFTVDFKSSVWHQNFEITNTLPWKYTINKVSVSVNFAGVDLVYNGTDQSRTLLSYADIGGNGAKYVSASDFRLTVPGGKMIDAQSYTFEVAFANEAFGENFNLTYSNVVTIAPRNITIKLSTVFISAFEWDEAGGAGAEYDITKFLYVDASALADGDTFVALAGIGTDSEEGYIEGTPSSVEYKIYNSRGEEVKKTNYNVSYNLRATLIAPK